MDASGVDVTVAVVEDDGGDKFVLSIDNEIKVSKVDGLKRS